MTLSNSNPLSFQKPLPSQLQLDIRRMVNRNPDRNQTIMHTFFICLLAYNIIRHSHKVKGILLSWNTTGTGQGQVQEIASKTH
mmetsp:Transcript_19531/g.29469  ORF Transcript_19531/g.29469 Transcript_19531/m.29469 type:complete len:83 (+) Transcript_19531:365-613(+)